MINEKVICAGFGGQGVMKMGQIITYSGMMENKHVSWLPSYGPEMRGGTANCAVMVSETPIGSPVITNDATAVIVMNLPSLVKFEENAAPGSRILVNSSLIEQKVSREDVEAFYIPCNEIALELGNAKVANMVMLGAYLQLANPVKIETVFKAMVKVFGENKAKFMPMNEEAIKKGMEIVKEQIK
ncbi:2-oxoacid:acceptor oxidoreductase family protein [Clostridiaceae bacterium HSG29]|nr:2-oxoacid:acceptor oxidoreductase family protein [Clostridiaceae bacterium HSG29]